jgi:predicted transcriptional regulator
VLPVKRTSTTLKLPTDLKNRISRAAERSGRTPHAFMIEALERQTAREERLADFVAEALAADGAIEAGGEVYGAADVHAWLGRLARGQRAPRPKPWRG